MRRMIAARSGEIVMGILSKSVFGKKKGFKVGLKELTLVARQTETGSWFQVGRNMAGILFRKKKMPWG